MLGKFWYNLVFFLTGLIMIIFKHHEITEPQWDIISPFIPSPLSLFETFTSRTTGAPSEFY